MTPNIWCSLIFGGTILEKKKCSPELREPSRALWNHFRKESQQMFILEINSVGRSHLSKGYMCKHAQMLPNLLIDLSNNNQRSVCLVFFFLCKIPLKGSKASGRLPTCLLISAWCAQSAESCWHSTVQVEKTWQTGGSHSLTDSLEEQESAHL